MGLLRKNISIIIFAVFFSSISPPASFEELEKGDILFANVFSENTTLKMYAVNYSHTGLYAGNSTVYEALPEGVALKPLSRWKDSGINVTGGRFAISRIPSDVMTSRNILGCGRFDGPNLTFKIPEGFRAGSLDVYIQVWQSDDRDNSSLLKKTFTMQK
jgi:hypothetical protein